MSKRQTVRTSDGWVRLYHLSWWSVIADFYGFFLESLAGLVGVAGLLYFSYGLVGTLSNAALAGPRLSWPAMLGGLAGCALMAWWGLSSVWQLLLDTLKPALTYEGPADRVEVKFVTTTHGGYHDWRLTSGEKTWSVPTPPTSLDTRVQTGQTVRLRFRAGTETVTDVWVRDGKPRHKRAQG